MRRSTAVSMISERRRSIRMGFGSRVSTSSGVFCSTSKKMPIGALVVLFCRAVAISVID